MQAIITFLAAVLAICHLQLAIALDLPPVPKVWARPVILAQGAGAQALIVRPAPIWTNSIHLLASVATNCPSTNTQWYAFQAANQLTGPWSTIVITNRPDILYTATNRAGFFRYCTWFR